MNENLNIFIFKAMNTNAFVFIPVNANMFAFITTYPNTVGNMNTVVFVFASIFVITVSI